MRPLRSIALAALVALLAPARAGAQATYGQYLLVLDDSGSMDGTDPRRLVVMAALAFAGALEDGDQVMLVGLNELASGSVTGPRFVSPRELLAERDGPEGAQNVDVQALAHLANHHGPTPCRDALERARSILNAMASAGAPQTLLLLTDGACNGGAVEPPDAWLGGVRAHADGRFRFVLLMQEGERLDPTLVEYARRTGYSGHASVSFDARALLRAFAEVLSFSRGLRYDDGGRIGLERTFAGARSVRVLAIQEQGVEQIRIERLVGGAASPVPAGPTYRHPSYGWSLRATRVGASDVPFALRSATAGAEVMVLPVYGRLRVEGVVAPCGEPPPLPWSTERAVRAGQPACAWARLVGDAGETIHPTRSFGFQLELCTDARCADASAMQSGDDGTFHAQLGAHIALGRHERTFRASGEGLASAITARHGFSALSFGVHRIALASEPERALEQVDLGVLPEPTASDLELVVSGAFPAGAHADIACEVEASEEAARCVTCAPSNARVALSDPFRLQVEVRASAFCPAVSASDGRELPIRMRVRVSPDTDEVPEHAISLRARLRYARAERVEVSVRGGDRSEASLRVPGPVAQSEVQARFELEDVEGLTGGLARERQTLRADDARQVELPVFAEAEDCCGAGRYEGWLVLSSASGQPELRVPLTVRVEDPGFWTCPGKQILKWTLVALGILFFGWVVHGMVSPARFREGALLMWATTHEGLLRLREGDEGVRRLDRFVETKRGFRRPAALHLGGPRAPLPSLKRLPVDARIEATTGGGATLVVTGSGVEKFEESSGWIEVAPGQYPVSNRIILRRGDDIYLSLRR